MIYTINKQRLLEEVSFTRKFRVAIRPKNFPAAAGKLAGKIDKSISYIKNGYTIATTAPGKYYKKTTDKMNEIKDNISNDFNTSREKERVAKKAKKAKKVKKEESKEEESK